MNEETYTARLEGWSLWNQDARGFQIRGKIFDDINRRWGDGTDIQTSLVIHQIVSEGDIVQTCNSKYLLGRKETE